MILSDDLVVVLKCRMFIVFQPHFKRLLVMMNMCGMDSNYELVIAGSEQQLIMFKGGGCDPDSRPWKARS